MSRIFFDLFATFAGAALLMLVVVSGMGYVLGVSWPFALPPTATGGSGGATDPVVYEVESMLKDQEGFRSKPYPDSRGVLTIGYGTAIGIGISEQEGEILLRAVLLEKSRELLEKWPGHLRLPVEAQAAVLDMSYQLGVAGVLEFHKMVSALQVGDYRTAAHEAINSDWHRETPARAVRVSGIFLKLAKSHPYSAAGPFEWWLNPPADRWGWLWKGAGS